RRDHRARLPRRPGPGHGAGPGPGHRARHRPARHRHERGRRDALGGRQGCRAHRGGRHARHPCRVPRQGTAGHGVDLPDQAAPRQQAGGRQGRQPALPQPDLLRRTHLARPGRVAGRARSPGGHAQRPHAHGSPRRPLGRPPRLDRRALRVIDFRYHLVSLVAVFMALAVGIVLGAGPLGQEISSTLEAQVRDLREERNGLRDQLGQAEAREDLKDEVLELVTPTVTANQLTGRRVALVALPGADRNLIGELQDDIAVAGGEAVVTARLEDRWSDPESAQNRHDLAAELAPELVLPTPRDGEEPTAETVLAAALTGQDASVGTGAWRNAMDRLSEEGFLDTTWTTGQDAVTSGAPDSVVIITGSLSTAQVEEAADGDTRLQQSLDIISAFGDLGVPTLVAGSGTESYSDPVQASESPVVRGVRAESA